MRTANTILLLSCSPLLAQDPGTARVDRADLSAHYERVERELRAGPAPADAARAEARARALDLLHEYRERADYGRAPDGGARVPGFVDPEGRRCAVAFLLDRTGGADLTLLVQRQCNHAWVASLAGNEALCQWLANNGLTLEEAARIQGPRHSYSPPPPSPPLPDPLAPVASGTRDPASPARSSGPGATSTATGARAGTVNATNAAPVAGRQATLRGTALVDLDGELWSSWWTWNRAALLVPARIGDRFTAGATTPLQPVHARVTPVLTAALDAPEAPVRAAAALALGRTGGDLSLLRARLDDPSLEVRMAAALAIGANDSAASRRELLGLATAKGPTAVLAPLAVVALVSGASAASGDADAIGSSRVQGDYAAALAATSGGRVEAPQLRERCSKLLAGNGDAVLRARAAEVLAVGADAATVAQLTEALSGPSVDVRRSAALALGRSRHALALPALLTAFELEHELLTRAFVLLAIGDHGADRAAPFLLEQVAEGKKPLRAWAALGLGLWGRDRDDAAVRAAVRAAFRGETNRDQDGAWLLSLGMLRDRESVPAFTAGLSGRDSRTRAAAADALALSGWAAAPATLRAALGTDSCPYVRSALAAALGSCGGPADVAALAAAARTDAVPEVRGAAAFALGAMGSEPALAVLLDLARSADPAVRAGALRGLGRIARTSAVPAAAVRTRQANFTLFPDWLGWALNLEQ